MSWYAWFPQSLAWLNNSETRSARIVRVFLGVLAGIILVTAGDVFESHRVGRITGELGVAVIVATVAVFAIELRGHDRLIEAMVGMITKKADEQQAKIKLATDEMVQRDDLHFAKLEVMAARMTAVAEEHFAKLSKMLSTNSHVALGAALESVFADLKELDKTLYESTMALITSVEQLNLAKTWTNKMSLRFIGSLLGFVSVNAQNLVHAALTGGAYDIKLPASGAELADSILAEQMATMDKGDAYIVISDISSWVGGLGEFLVRTEVALKKGVKVRRIVCPFDWDKDVQEDQVNAVLARHWREDLFTDRDEHGRPMYELGIVSSRTVKEKRLFHIKHMGVFHHQNETACFHPQHDNLSDMQFSQGDKIGNDFDSLWGYAHPNFRFDASGDLKLVPLTDLMDALGKDWWK